MIKCDCFYQDYLLGHKLDSFVCFSFWNILSSVSFWVELLKEDRK